MYVISFFFFFFPSHHNWGMKPGQDNSGLNTPHPLTRTQATPLASRHVTTSTPLHMLQPVVPNRCHPKSMLPRIGPFSFPIKISFFFLFFYLVLTGDNTAAHPLAWMVATPTTKHPNPCCLNPRCLNTIPPFVLERGLCQSHAGACPPFCTLPPPFRRERGLRRKPTPRFAGAREGASPSLCPCALITR
jgi:hypothetical protein